MKSKDDAGGGFIGSCEVWLWDNIFTFLTAGDTSRLDRALCNRAARAPFLEALKLCSQKSGTFVTWNDQTADFLYWMTRRRMQHRVIEIETLPYEIPVAVAVRSIQHLAQLREIVIRCREEEEKEEEVVAASPPPPPPNGDDDNVEEQRAAALLLALKQQRQLLIMLRHGSRCKKPQCAAKYCIPVKNLWNHVSQCKNTQCQTIMCRNARTVMTHYIQCKDFLCLICNPVRNAIMRQDRYDEISRHLIMVKEMNILYGLVKDTKAYQSDLPKGPVVFRQLPPPPTTHHHH